MSKPIVEKAEGASLLGWLGFRNSRGGDETIAPSRPSAAAGVRSVLDHAKQQLLDEIAAFVLAHELEVTPANLALACEAFSGANPGLARQIVTRTQSGDAITQEWLDEATATAKPPEDSSLRQLIGQLEATLAGFGKSSSAARSATARYGDQLQQHVSDLQGADGAQMITNLADLARAMLERTRKVEDEMRQSEEEAKALRKKLAVAQRDAEIDHLTGLPNRRAFETLLETHYREAQAAIEPLSVAFCDIDHFKRINDTHGHDSGDRVIKEIGEMLSRISDDKCHVARHGGEEFVMLFHGLVPKEAKARLDTAREAMAARNLVNRKTDEPFGRITFSGGVADVFGYPDPREALKAADEALYRAKESGRNRIALAGE
ncbi:MAG TPA: GGDEF domain-containing protein [Novosphingobium sp.]